MDLWDQDAVELLGPAIIAIMGDGSGTIQFIAVEAQLDHGQSERDGQLASEFSGDGNDEGSPTRVDRSSGGAGSEGGGRGTWIGRDARCLSRAQGVRRSSRWDPAAADGVSVHGSCHRTRHAGHG